MSQHREDCIQDVIDKMTELKNNPNAQVQFCFYMTLPEGARLITSSTPETTMGLGERLKQKAQESFSGK